MQQETADRISLRLHSRRVRVRAEGTLIADSQQAVELREIGYPARQYLPREDVNMQLLKPTDTQSHCPFKGDATYFAIELDGKTILDAAWSYEQPYEAMAEIAGLISFDERHVEQSVQ